MRSMLSTSKSVCCRRIPAAVSGTLIVGSWLLCRPAWPPDRLAVSITEDGSTVLRVCRQPGASTHTTVSYPYISSGWGRAPLVYEPVQIIILREFILYGRIRGFALGACRAAGI